MIDLLSELQEKQVGKGSSFDQRVHLSINQFKKETFNAISISTRLCYEKIGLLTWKIRLTPRYNKLNYNENIKILLHPWCI